MWTSDAIEALEALQAKFGYPICIDSVEFSPFGGYIYLEFDDGSYYTWSIKTKELNYFLGR